jgi:hypothetical protein
MLQIGSGYITPKTAYQNLLVYAVQGYVYLCDPYGNTSTAGNQAAPFFNPTNPISMAYLNLDVFMTDGSTIAQLNMSTGSMQTYTASTGIAPTYVANLANWRGRLVAYGDQNNPQNFYMSRLGNPYDWNYAAEDEAAAVAGNLSLAGQIGTPIVSFVPFTDDLSVFSCDQSMWLVEGDPAAGGIIAILSNHIGCLGPNAWCTDDKNFLYFVGNAGLFEFRPFFAEYVPPNNLTAGKYDAFFNAIDRNENYVTLVYDAVLLGIHIFVSPISGGGGTHLFYDLRTQSLWPIQYAPSIGPNCALAYTPGSPGVKQIFALGGLDGNIYKIDQGALDDNGTAISSFVTFAPVNPNPQGEAILNRVQLDMGEQVAPYGTSTVTINVSTNVDAAGNIFTYFSTGTLIGTVNSTNTNFSTNGPINANNFESSYYVTSSGGTINGGTPTFNGGNSITIQHPVQSTYVIAGTSTQTVGFSVRYADQSTYTVPGFLANINVIAGPTAADVMGDGYSTSAASQWNSDVTFDRRQPAMLGRLSGGWFGLTISNSTDGAQFSFERAELTFVPSGRNRKYR